MKPVLFGLAAALVVIVIVLAPAARNPAASPQDEQDVSFASPAVVRAESVRVAAAPAAPAAPPTFVAPPARSADRAPARVEPTRVAAAPATPPAPVAPPAYAVDRPSAAERLATAHHTTGDNVITNGSFEFGGDTTDNFMWYFPGSGAIHGWTILGKQVDYIGGHWPSADGRRSVDLNGSPGRGGIMQTFATQSGEVYEVNFHLAGNPRGNFKGADPVKHLVVEISSGSYNTPHLYTFDTTGRDVRDIGWVRHCFTFRAAAPSTTIRFLSQEPDHEWGPAIDNVIVHRAAP